MVWRLQIGGGGGGVGRRKEEEEEEEEEEKEEEEEVRTKCMECGVRVKSDYIT